MFRYIPLIAAAGLIAACSPDTPTGPDPASTPDPGPVEATDADPSTPAAGQNGQAGSECGTITVEGLCGVTFGMSAEEAMVAHAAGLHEMGGAGGQPESCYYLGPDPDNYDIGYMVVDGQVQRIDIRAPGVSTSEGVQVGMQAGEVEGIYPNLERAPNKYTDRDNLIVGLGGDTKLVMETDENGNIAAYRIGVPPAVDYVEGCA